MTLVGFFAQQRETSRRASGSGELSLCQVWVEGSNLFARFSFIQCHMWFPGPAELLLS
ncbi:hypothetical protein [Novosphingopyxis sp.]|uniref:hypothetical protein n=1 Tax=Novosphingopyxis sp. TaxID=2709690 RepID=UPI003B58F1C3